MKKKSNVLNRNFMFFGDLVEYLHTLETKADKCIKTYNKQNLRELFANLEILKEKDEEKYKKVIEFMKQYTEDFVLTYSYMLSGIINMTDREQEVMMAKFNKVDYNESFESIGLISTIVNRYNEIVNTYCDEILEDIEVENISNVAMELRTNNQEFAASVFEKLLSEYPLIKEYPLFCKLLIDLNEDCGKMVYEYMTSVREQIVFDKESVYNTYFRKSSNERNNKILRGVRPNRPSNFNR